jgi:hypothetical protein
VSHRRRRSTLELTASNYSVSGFFCVLCSAAWFSLERRISVRWILEVSRNEDSRNFMMGAKSDREAWHCQNPTELQRPPGIMKTAVEERLGGASHPRGYGDWSRGKLQNHP